MTTEIRNWAVVAASMEAQGATDNQMCICAKSLEEGRSDPMPISSRRLLPVFRLLEIKVTNSLVNHQAIPI